MLSKVVGPKRETSSPCCVKILKEKNKTFIHSKLPKINYIAKNIAWSFRFKEHGFAYSKC